MTAQQTPFERSVAAVRPQAKGPIRAPKTTILQPSDFAYDYGNRPATPIVVGLRYISAADAERGLAFSTMEAKTPDAQRQALGVFCVARGICDPNDIEKPHPNFECAEDLIPIALSRVTIDRILAELAALVVESGPLETEADNDEVQQLGMMLCVDDPFQHIDAAHVAMARRHIRLALNELLDGYQATPE